MILLYAPKLGQTGWIDDLEDTSVATLPRDQIAVLLIAIVEQLLQEIPQQTTI